MSGYHIDTNGLEAALAPALPLSGARWHLGGGGEGKGTGLYFSDQISSLPFIGVFCSALLNPPVLALQWYPLRLTWNIPCLFFYIVCELQMCADHIFVLHWFRALSGDWLTWLQALALAFSGCATLGKLSSFLPALGVIVRIRDKHVWGLWHQDWHRWMLREVSPPTPSLGLAPKCLLTHQHARTYLSAAWHCSPRLVANLGRQPTGSRSPSCHSSVPERTCLQRTQTLSFESLIPVHP